jgi:Ion channel
MESPLDMLTSSDTTISENSRKITRISLGKHYLVLFIDYFRLIKVWYWAVTTLATVGYGDYHPISNGERVITACIFLVGVAAFSFIMGNFIEMVMEFRTVTKENEDSAGLSQFFSLLARFNSGHPIPKDTMRKIEQYFDYYWTCDLNYAMKSESDQRFIAELPKEIRVNVTILSKHSSH